MHKGRQSPVFEVTMKRTNQVHWVALKAAVVITIGALLLWTVGGDLFQHWEEVTRNLESEEGAPLYLSEEELRHVRKPRLFIKIDSALDQKPTAVSSQPDPVDGAPRTFE